MFHKTLFNSVEDDGSNSCFLTLLILPNEVYFLMNMILEVREINFKTVHSYTHINDFSEIYYNQFKMQISRQYYRTSISTARF